MIYCKAAGPVENKHIPLVATIVFGVFVAVLGVFIVVQQVGSSGSGRGVPRPDQGRKTQPHIDSIEAVYGRGNKVLLRGSGLTATGNTYRARANYYEEPLSSPEGKTMQFRLWLAVIGGGRSQAPWGQCGSGETCSVPIQIINGQGAASNIVNFDLTHPPPTEPLLLTSQRVDSLSSQAVPAGTPDVPVLATALRADAQNYDDIYVDRVVAYLSGDRPLNCDATFGPLTLLEGEQVLATEAKAFGVSYTPAIPLSDGSCYTVFQLATRPLLPSQDDPAQFMITPGQERTLSLRVTVPLSAPPTTAFRARMVFNLVSTYLQHSEEGPQSGSTVTITAPATE